MNLLLQIICGLALHLALLPVSCFLLNILHSSLYDAWNRTRLQLGLHKTNNRKRVTNYPPIDQDIPDEDFFEVPLPPDDKN